MAGSASAERLVAVGLSHRTAPVTVREQFAFDEDAVRRQLDRLCGEGVCEEAMLLSTCNRVELYSVPTDLERLRAYFDEFRGPGGERIGPHLYWLPGREAVSHLFKVASALDSLVVGEPQILGQVKTAVRLAQEQNSLGRILRPLTNRSFTVAKRVRTETDLGRGRVGIGNAGVDLAMQVYGDLRSKRALLLGVGEMGTQVARALLSAGLEELLVTNRTFSRATEVAAEYNGTAIPWERMDEYLSRVDVVIGATGARNPIVSKALVKSALKARRYRPLLLVDLSVPRNIDPAVDDLDDAYLFNIDDLSQVVEEGRKARAEATVAAKALVAEETDKFLRTLAEINVGPYLGRLSAKLEALRIHEIGRSKKLTRDLDASQLGALDLLTRSLMKKALHQPMIALRKAAREGDPQRIHDILAMWGVEEDE